MPSRFRFLRPLLTLVVVLGLLSSQAPGKKSAGNSASISEEELRAKVQVMADSFSGQLGSLSLRVSADTTDNDIRRGVLFLKMGVITIIESLRAFDIVYVINKGRNGLELLSVAITNNIIGEASRIGFRSTMAVVLVVISLGVIIPYLYRTFKTEETPA